MNFPEENKRALKQLHDFASTDWDDVKHANEAGKQAVKMETALKMVLEFHSGEAWTADRSNEWYNLQIQAGRSEAGYEATTKILCDTIREVLGMEARR